MKKDDKALQKVGLRVADNLHSEWSQVSLCFFLQPEAFVVAVRQCVAEPVFREVRFAEVLIFPFLKVFLMSFVVLPLFEVVHHQD